MMGSPPEGSLFNLISRFDRGWFIVWALMLPAAILLVGCVRTDSIRYEHLPAKPIDQVELLAGPPDRPFKVIGHVMLDGPRLASWQRMAEAAREEAAELGADAVFLGDLGQYQSGSVIMPGHSTTTTTGTTLGSSFSATSHTFGGPTMAMPVIRKQATAIAIRYVK